MKIAVIGSGISGLSVSHFLSKKHKVDLFEKNNHFGGHSYTVELPLENSKVSSNKQTRILWNAPRTWLVISFKEDIINVLNEACNDKNIP